MRLPRPAKLGPLLALALALGAPACGPAPGPEEPNDDTLTPKELYPLAPGNVWNYNVDTGQDLPTLAQTSVVSVQGNRYEVAPRGGESIVYELRDQGIYRPGNDTWLLKAPIEIGAEWPSSAGMTARIESVGVSVETPAGQFEGCVKVEETGGEAGRYIATVYCPDVGPVLIESKLRTEVSQMEAEVTARLLGYAFGRQPAPAPE